MAEAWTRKVLDGELFKKARMCGDPNCCKEHEIRLRCSDCDLNENFAVAYKDGLVSVICCGCNGRAALFAIKEG